jgi:hypothetical protein
MAAKTKPRTRTVIMQAPKAAAPIIKVTAPRAAPVTRRRRRRVGASRSGGGGSDAKTMVGAGIGGYIFGFIENKFPNLPTLPVVGRAGTVALACYFLRKQGGFGRGTLVRDVGHAAAVLAGYQLGKTGKISGDDVDGDGDLSQQI